MTGQSRGDFGIQGCVLPVIEKRAGGNWHGLPRDHHISVCGIECVWVPPAPGRR